MQERNQKVKSRTLKSEMSNLVDQVAPVMDLPMTKAVAIANVVDHYYDAASERFFLYVNSPRFGEGGRLDRATFIIRLENHVFYSLVVLGFGNTEEELGEKIEELWLKYEELWLEEIEASSPNTVGLDGEDDDHAYSDGGVEEDSAHETFL